MNTPSTSTENKFIGLILAVTLTCFLWTGCASKPRLIIPRAARVAVNDENMVALMHQGKIIYVNENAVESCLAHGDTFAINKKGKSFYGNEQQLKQYLK